MSVEELDSTSTTMKFRFNPRVYTKTAKLFGEIMGYDISVEFTTNVNTCMIGQHKENLKKFTIFLNPNLEYIPTEEILYACEEHELAHPLFGSDAVAIKSGAEEISKRYYDYGICVSEVEAILRILDDQRIESCWAELYYGSLAKFKKIRHNLVSKAPASVSIILLSARGERKDLVHPYFYPFYNFCKKMLFNVERKAFSIIFKVAELVVKEWIKIIQQYLNDYQQQQQQKNKNRQKKQSYSDKVSMTGSSDNGDSGDSKKSSKDDINDNSEDKSKKDQKESSDKQSKDDKSNDDKNIKDDVDNKPKAPAPVSFDKNSGTVDFKPELSKLNDPDLEKSLGELDEIFDDFQFDDSEMDSDGEAIQIVPASKDDVSKEIKQRYITETNNYNEETEIDLKTEVDIPSILDGKLDDISYTSEEEFDAQLTRIRHILDKFKPPSPTRNIYLPIKDGISNFNRQPAVFEFKQDVNRLKKIFRRIIVNNQSGEELDCAGELEVDQFIQFKMGNADPEVFVNETDDQNFNLVLVIDGSGSMSNLPLQTAKRIALTMIKSVKNIPNINVDIWIFGGNWNSTPIAQLTEHSLKIIGTGGCTHTNDAVRYISQQAKYSFKKNIMFIITDGEPVSNNQKYAKILEGKDMQYIQADTHFAIQEARKRGWKVFTFFIGDPRGNSGIFGHPFVIMKDYSKLTDILGYFEKEVIKFLRR